MTLSTPPNSSSDPSPTSLSIPTTPPAPATVPTAAPATAPASSTSASQPLPLPLSPTLPLPLSLPFPLPLPVPLPLPAMQPHQHPHQHHFPPAPSPAHNPSSSASPMPLQLSLHISSPLSAPTPPQYQHHQQFHSQLPIPTPTATITDLPPAPLHFNGSPTPPLTPVTAPTTPTPSTTLTPNTPAPAAMPSMSAHYHHPPVHDPGAPFCDLESPSTKSNVNVDVNAAAVSGSSGRVVTDSFEAEADSIIRALDDAMETRRNHDVPSLGVRTAVEQLPECSNPLEKDGRNTVIRGRLPHNHPFAVASQDLGYRLVSPQYSGYSCQQGECSERIRMRLFLLDCNAVYRQLKGNDIKVPIIGGGPLDLFKLQQEVLLLGGLHNVVDKRAFRIVAQQLELPATCTSAAYVLKGTYERFLYHYEQLIVFGAWPQDGGAQPVNMRSLITQQRERAKRTSINGFNPHSPQQHHEHQHTTLPQHREEQHPSNSQSQSTTTTATTTGHVQTRSQAQYRQMNVHMKHHPSQGRVHAQRLEQPNHHPQGSQHTHRHSHFQDKNLNTLSSRVQHPPGMPSHLERSKDTTHPGLGISPASLYTQLTVGIGNGPNSSGLSLGNVNQVAADLALPRWALELPGDDAYEALIRAASNVEKRGQGKILHRLFSCTSHKVRGEESSGRAHQGAGKKLGRDVDHEIMKRVRRNRYKVKVLEKVDRRSNYTLTGHHQSSINRRQPNSHPNPMANGSDHGADSHPIDHYQQDDNVHRDCVYDFDRFLRTARTRAEIVMLAVAECFEIDQNTYGRLSSMGIAKMICAFDSSVCNGRKAQSVMLSILIKLTARDRKRGIFHDQHTILAENSSSEGLLDGLFTIIQEFHMHYLKTHGDVKDSLQEAMKQLEDEDDKEQCKQPDHRDPKTQSPEELKSSDSEYLIEKSNAQDNGDQEEEQQSLKKRKIEQQSIDKQDTEQEAAENNDIQSRDTNSQAKSSAESIDDDHRDEDSRSKQVANNDGISDSDITSKCRNNEREHSVEISGNGNEIEYVPGAASQDKEKKDESNKKRLTGSSRDEIERKPSEDEGQTMQKSDTVESDQAQRLTSESGESQAHPVRTDDYNGRRNSSDALFQTPQMSNVPHITDNAPRETGMAKNIPPSTASQARTQNKDEMDNSNAYRRDQPNNAALHVENCDTWEVDQMNPRNVDEDNALSFCALRAAEGLTRTRANHNMIVSHRLFMPVIHALLCSSRLPRLHLVVLVRMIHATAPTICAVGDTDLLHELMRAAIVRCLPIASDYTLPGSHLQGCQAMVDTDIAPPLLRTLATCVNSGIVLGVIVGCVAKHALCNGFVNEGLELIEALVNKRPTIIIQADGLLECFLQHLKNKNHEISYRVASLVETLFQKCTEIKDEELRNEIKKVFLKFWNEGKEHDRRQHRMRGSHHQNLNHQSQYRQQHQHLHQRQHQQKQQQQQYTRQYHNRPQPQHQQHQPQQQQYQHQYQHLQQPQHTHIYNSQMSHKQEYGNSEIQRPYALREDDAVTVSGGMEVPMVGMVGMGGMGHALSGEMPSGVNMGRIEMGMNMNVANGLGVNMPMGVNTNMNMNIDMNVEMDNVVDVGMDIDMDMEGNTKGLQQAQPQQLQHQQVEHQQQASNDVQKRGREIKQEQQNDEDLDKAQRQGEAIQTDGAKQPSQGPGETRSQRPVSEDKPKASETQRKLTEKGSRACDFEEVMHMLDQVPMQQQGGSASASASNPDGDAGNVDNNNSAEGGDGGNADVVDDIEDDYDDDDEDGPGSSGTKSGSGDERSKAVNK